mmetsp:Transcript_11598/g.22820  ORF Transcript_11598/g.22820 Transcript_11598/m.22820 type:complete len:796 (-) Transcript_11598:1754-4141(-)|eukprot:CAMPEP_0171571196 /NCGR_PEP_ID=MMETSP0961-20121227/3381_1 /TAXON_ID=87120 /ORGANISM="Aurantiochytrium limacinum, Strain ATCCMYA-1381" /LENGTH=795 /DNA_ID=CAMNT_0012125801 /DNA_START=263 /DNA_END=2650 /DNA_ORIENTATION=-
MIVYDSRKLGGYDIFLHQAGSALFSWRSMPIAAASAIIATIFAYLTPLRDWLGLHVLQSTSYFGSISFIVGFTVVYRAQIAYSRYAEAQLAYFNMASKMHDFVSFLNSFLLDDTEHVQVLRETIIRWCRAYHELALEEFQGIDFALHHRVNLNQEEVELLARDRKRPIQVASWMHRLIMENREAFRAGDAILSRAFQVQTNANMYFNNARRISETPFPFPFVQLTSMMIHTWAILTPIIMASFFPTSYVLAGAIAGASTWILVAVNETAAQLELPFEPSVNNLPTVYYTVAFDDDMSSIQYMEVPEVFYACRERDFTALKSKARIHKQEGLDSEPGEYDSPELDKDAYAGDAKLEKSAMDRHRALMKNFRFRNKLDEIKEPGNDKAVDTLRRLSEESDSVNAPQTSSTSKLFDLFSINPDDIKGSGTPTNTNQAEPYSNTEELKPLNLDATSSDEDEEDAEERNEATDAVSEELTSQISRSKPSRSLDGVFGTSGASARSTQSDGSVGKKTSHHVAFPNNIFDTKEVESSSSGSKDDLENSSVNSATAIIDEVRLNIKEPQEDNDAIDVSRRASLPKHGLALDDSVISQRLRSLHDRSMAGKSTEHVDSLEAHRIENMDSRAGLYHTIHGTEAKKLARELQIEREIQRRSVANRALVMKLRVDQQRYDMRHHLRNVPSVSAGDFSDSSIMGTKSLDNIKEINDANTNSIGRSTTNSHHDGENPLDEMHRSRQSSSRRNSHYEHSEQDTLRSYNTLRRRIRGSSRKEKYADVVNWPGWTTSNLTCARTRGVFEVFT